MSNSNRDQILTVAIIAGGKSSRFGYPKADAKYQNSSLIETAVKIAQKISPNILIAAQNKNQFPDLKLPVYPDVVPNCGPIGGIYTALHFSKTEYVATLPCDLPLLRPEIIELLFQHNLADRPVVARSHLGCEPVVAIWPAILQPDLKQMIDNGEFSLFKNLRRLGSNEIDIPKLMPGYDKKWFFNVNYYEDLQKLNNSE